MSSAMNDCRNCYFAVKYKETFNAVLFCKKKKKTLIDNKKCKEWKSK